MKLLEIPDWIQEHPTWKKLKSGPRLTLGVIMSLAREEEGFWKAEMAYVDMAKAVGVNPSTLSRHVLALTIAGFLLKKKSWKGEMHKDEYWVPMEKP